MPDAEQYVDDFFKGGGLMHQSDDLKATSMAALKEHAGKDNYIGAALRLAPAINETLLSPLFNHYIPALKVGMFFKEFPVLLKENQSRIDNRTITRDKLARQQVSFIEDRLGEMNFDNLYWNRTFKTATQFMFRSVTWKLGNIRAMAGAPAEQAMEFYNAAKEDRKPNLMPKMAWLMGLTVMQVAMAGVIQKMLANKDIENFKDIVAPQINEKDPTERVIMPTYYKDLLHAYHAPGEYLSTSTSGPLGKIIDIWKNKDFYNYEIYDKNGGIKEKAKDILNYAVPKPFSISSSTQMIEKGEPASKVAMSFLGLNKAPGYLSHTPIENEIFDLYNIRNTSVKPLKEKEGNAAKKEIRDLYKTDKAGAQKLADKYIADGTVRPTQMKYLFSHVDKQFNITKMFFDKLPYSDKQHLFDKMSKEERVIYDPKNKMKQSKN
jgi:hypothetical protein